MRFKTLGLLVFAVYLTACSSNLPRVLNPNGGPQAFELTPSPVELTNDNPVSSFTVQNDAPGVSYTATADPSCQNSTGGIYVGGDGQSQLGVAGSPVIFVTYAAGTPPAGCTVTVRSSDGFSESIAVTYQTIVVESVRRSVSDFSVSASSVVSPSSVTITKLTQLVALTPTGFSGTVSAAVSGCPGSASGVEVNPKQMAAGGGTFSVVAFGQGNLSLLCTVTISDTAGDRATVPVTVSIGALAKFTATPTTVQFGCAGTTLPKHCQTIQTVTLQETGATSFQIADKPALLHTCANSFNGPLKFVSSGGTPALSAAGPTATVAFDGLLPTAALNCTRIVLTDGRDPAQTINISVKSELTAAPPPAISTAAAPPCKGNDPFVAVPGAPHGMYVWNPNHYLKYQTPLANDVIGKDPALCGASVVIYWADVEPSKNSFKWQPVLDAAAPYVNPAKGINLTVNLLFADSTEGPVNNVTPAWVTAPASQGGDGVPTITCPEAGSPAVPVFWNQTYEADWEAFIAAAVQEFSASNSSISANVGYMRFATGEGAEAIAPSGITDPQCSSMWQAAGFSYDAWQQHELNIVNAMGAQTTDKQLVASLPGISATPPPSEQPAGVPYMYVLANAFAAVAASKHIGLSFESLGSKYNSNGVQVQPVTPPAPCDPKAKIIIMHWCQAFHNYAGVVPLAMQPITASSDSSGPIDVTDMLQYALDNNIQIFELYPDDWIQADSPEFSTFIGKQAKYQAALHAASLVLGASP